MLQPDRTASCDDRIRQPGPARGAHALAAVAYRRPHAASARSSPAARRFPSACFARATSEGSTCCRAMACRRRRRWSRSSTPLNALRKVGSAGRPALFVDIRIVGHDGTDAAVGEIGELLVRGPNVMAGYWKRPEATRRAVDAARLAANRRCGAHRRGRVSLHRRPRRRRVRVGRPGRAPGTRRARAAATPVRGRGLCARRRRRRRRLYRSRSRRDEPESRQSCSRCAPSTSLFMRVRPRSSSCRLASEESRRQDHASPVAPPPFRLGDSPRFSVSTGSNGFQSPQFGVPHLCG